MRSIALYSIVVKALDDIYLSLFPGFYIRDALFNAAIKRYCKFGFSKKPECRNCEFAKGCIVSRYFEKNEKRIKNGNQWFVRADIPDMFISSIPKDTFIPEGSFFSFTISALSDNPDKEDEYINEIVIKFEEEGLGEKVYIDGNKLRRGRIFVHRVTRTEIIEDEIEKRIRELHEDRFLKISFLTPVALVSNGKFIRNFDPSIFYRRLITRLSLLGAGNFTKDVNIKMKESNFKVKLFRKYSTRNGNVKDIVVLDGHFIMENTIETLRPVVYGSYLGVGKYATHGLGQYSIEGV